MENNDELEQSRVAERQRERLVASLERLYRQCLGLELDFDALVNAAKLRVENEP